MESAIPARPIGGRATKTSAWSKVEVDRLIADWNAGEPSGKLATRYQRTRSAVVGMVRRLRDAGVAMRKSSPRDGLAGGQAKAAGRARQPSRPTAPPRTPSGPTRAQRVAALQELPEPPRAAEVAWPAGELKLKGVLDLEKDDCRWALGDPQHPDFYFCAQPKIKGLPYCEFHSRKAYQPAQPRRLGIPRLSANPSTRPTEQVKKEGVHV